MIDAVADRASLAATPVVKLVREFTDPASRASFDEWSRHPVTCRVSAALSEMALHAPSYLPSQDVPVQYGITLGLSMAVQLMTNPDTVFPAMFRGSSAVSGPFVESYGTTPDQALGE